MALKPLDFKKDRERSCSHAGRHVMEMETESQSPEPQPQQLCTSCGAPNPPSADFCVKCGAPISWYSKMGPFESIAARGFIWREAAERPRRLIVVVGMWLIFLPMAGTGLVFMQFGGTLWFLSGCGIILIPLAIIARTTWNYLSGKLNKPVTDK